MGEDEERSVGKEEVLGGWERRKRSTFRYGFLNEGQAEL